ncbi:hypothetical protein [Paraflavitalea pollutisoli]|uniref:hypothetical protein n=1 Tax=Paraflavitalea pollutisoli TaxID=3034143 RepID=UPI0023EB72A4|nr:hypothetical protein [Paraflavitalea sp. H1-2-19X]
MTQQEAIQITQQYIRNSAVDAFTNVRLNSVLLFLLAGGGVAPEFATGEDFQTAITDNPDAPLLAYIAQDDIYAFDTDVVLMYVPGEGVGQVAVDFDL